MELKKLEYGTPEHVFTGMVSQKKAFFVTQTPFGRRWATGDFNLSFSSDDRFTGEFIPGGFFDESLNDLPPVRDLYERLKQRRYAVTGAVETAGEPPKDQWHFVVQGEFRGRGESDLFVAHFFAPDRDQIHKTLVGVWLGRPTGGLPVARYAPDGGYLIWMNKESAESFSSEEDLNNEVRNFVDGFGEVRLELPSEGLPSVERFDRPLPPR
jgi:hypothetical protein